MNIYIICILCSVGAISRLSYFDALKKTRDIRLTIKDLDLINPKHLPLYSIGSILGTLLLLSNLVYGFINYREWQSLFILIGFIVISIGIFNVTKAILGGHASRVLFIWIMPVIGSIYFIAQILSK